MIKKKRLIVLTAAVCLMLSAVPVYADTMNFTVTVESKGRPDPLSKRTMKSDSEQRFYVTTTGFSGQGTIQANSAKLDGTTYSQNVFLSWLRIGERVSASYVRKAQPESYYYLDTFWTSGSSTRLTVSGRYTP